MSQETYKNIERIVSIFSASEGTIRPHFILTGPSGSGKSFSMEMIANKFDLPFIEVNAAALTKEGTSGNSVSKALNPLLQYGNSPVICFVDEFDKLFISGNVNSSLAHEVTNGVQNEFLKALEGSTAVFGDYGKYHTVKTDKVLFVFAGAFNGEENITLDRLRDFGIKTEFLGRVGLTYAMEKLSLDDLENILKNSSLLINYSKLIPEANKDEAVKSIMGAVKENYENNTLGARILYTLTHQFFIEGSLNTSRTKEITFQKTLPVRA